MRTLEWDSSSNKLKIIDQRILPSKLAYLHLSSHEEVAESIRNMAVRGAPAIGVAAAYGIVLAALNSPANTIEGVRKAVIEAKRILATARPTAVNLFWALDRMLKVAEQDYLDAESLKNALLSEANRMADEDVKTNMAMARIGAELIEDGDVIIHHCNTGALATVDWGTALGAIRLAHKQGKRIHVLVDETRPRLQGARLTAWELKQYGIPFDLISDNAAGFFLKNGQATKVFFGADRVARNGDVVNKIGSYMLALAAHDNHVPVYSVFPLSTVDLRIERGELIPIEERPPAEVLEISLQGQRATPEGATARNPAFDITPHRLINAWVTEAKIIHPPFYLNLPDAVKSAAELAE